MADQSYFQGHLNGWDMFQVATGPLEPPDAPKSIRFGSNRQNVGWTEGDRAFLKEGIWDSHVKVEEGDRERQMFAIDCSPIAAFANPSYITEGKKVVWHNAIEGTRIDVCGSTDQGCYDIYEFDLGEFKEFAGSWNDRHCGKPSDTFMDFNHPAFGPEWRDPVPAENSAIFPPLTSDGIQ